MPDAKQLSFFGQNELSRQSMLKEAVGPFLQYLLHEGKSQNTITSFRSDLNLLAGFMSDEILLGQIGTARLNEFLEWLEFGRGVPCSKKSYARRVTTLKVFFKWLKESGVRSDDPALGILQRSGPAPLQPIVSDEEVAQLFRYAQGLRTAKKPDTRPYLLFLLLLETGIKKSETVSLTRDSIEERDSARPTILVQYGRLNVFKERRLPVSQDWVVALDEYLAQYEPKHNLIFDCTPRNLEYVLTDLARDAGVESKVSFETMRWTCAVRAYRAGMEMDSLREKLGLSEISWRETSQKIMKIAAQPDEV